jgi:hypothetical protein
MVHNLPWKVSGCSDGQDISSILWNRKIYYHVNKSPPLDLILNQTIQAHISTINSTCVGLRTQVTSKRKKAIPVTGRGGP